jgi:hypothetical protein
LGEIQIKYITTIITSFIIVEESLMNWGVGFNYMRSVSRQHDHSLRTNNMDTCQNMDTTQCTATSIHPFYRFKQHANIISSLLLLTTLNQRDIHQYNQCSLVLTIMQSLHHLLSLFKHLSLCLVRNSIIIITSFVLRNRSWTEVSVTRQYGIILQ